MAYRHVLPFSLTADMVLYLAAMSFDPGGCAIAFADGPLANRVFGLEVEEETTFYSMPVGNVGPNNQKAGDAF